ncbi:response regulator [Sessilibacter sp. MAH4]
MFEFYTPKSKVQKDRKLIYETDSRISKYSRRGLLLTLAVFSFTMWLGGFFKENSSIAFFLASGLLVTTIFRGYLVFGFESFYPRAPGRWRNLFFFGSILGSFWWGIIISVITYTSGFHTETNFLWLYTIVFYSGMTGVLSPYRRFLTVYLLSGLVPIILASLSTNTIEGVLHSSIVIFLFWMLRNQGLMMCDSYWERLEANYVLRQRADSLEIEKRDSQAAAQVNHEFLVSLSDELRSALNDTVGALSVLAHESGINEKQRYLLSIAEKSSERQLQVVNSVIDYSKIKSQKLVLENTVFNFPKLVEECFNEKEIEAEINGKEFSINYGDNVPSRVRGDSVRTAQLINCLIDQSISLSTGPDLKVNINCEDSGGSELIVQICIVDESSSARAGQSKVLGAKAGSFSLNMSEHLALAMGGNIGINDDFKLMFLLDLPLTPVNSQSFFKQFESKFDTERILLVDTPSKVQEEIKDILISWGLVPIFKAVDDRFDAISDLDQSDFFQEINDPMVSAIIIFSKKESLTAIPISQKFLTSNSLKLIPQLIVVSHLQAESKLLLKHSNEKDSIRILQKPLTQDKLYLALSQILLNQPDPTDNINIKVLLIEDSNVDQLVISNIFEKLGISVDLTSTAEAGLKKMAQRDYDMVFITCHLNGRDDAADSLEFVAKAHAETPEDQKRTPIIGLTTLKNDHQDRLCLTSGMDDTVAKPVRKEELKKCLDHWLVKTH